MADAIDVVAGLYADGVLVRAGRSFPDLLALEPDSAPIEFRLWRMFSERRGRGFMGAFHQSPDHAHWQGWAGLQEDLLDIPAFLRRQAD
mgnify:CR=1 FL=1